MNNSGKRVTRFQISPVHMILILFYILKFILKFENLANVQCRIMLNSERQFNFQVFGIFIKYHITYILFDRSDQQE